MERNAIENETLPYSLKEVGIAPVVSQTGYGATAREVCIVPAFPVRSLEATLKLQLALIESGDEVAETEEPL